VCAEMAPPAPRNDAALYSPWPTRWNSAAANAPTATCTTMKPICPAVDQASAPLTSERTSITAVARSAVATPTANANVIAALEAPTTGAVRRSRTPAPLITPACNRAETGVGAASVEGSQRCSGTSAERATPAITNRTATIGRTGTSPPASGTAARPTASAAAAPVGNGSDPTVAATRPSPATSARSPTIRQRRVCRAARAPARRSARRPTSATTTTLVATHAP
jgi:hypothetical protein